MDTLATDTLRAVFANIGKYRAILRLVCKGWNQEAAALLPRIKKRADPRAYECYTLAIWQDPGCLSVHARMFPRFYAKEILKKTSNPFEGDKGGGIRRLPSSTHMVAGAILPPLARAICDDFELVGWRRCPECFEMLESTAWGHTTRILLHHADRPHPYVRKLWTHRQCQDSAFVVLHKDERFNGSTPATLSFWVLSSNYHCYLAHLAGVR
jgi:hypothetical protein